MGRRELFELMHACIFVFSLVITFTIVAVICNELLLFFGYSGFLEPAMECEGLPSES